ncbi:hypothetical protein AX15_003190 [Amanita polypyramis BW_CC]|nr:hypothetical protein AX15_003190 [Amanita polypyramis BW_CC]
MRSFNLSVLATIACAVFSVAAPIGADVSIITGNGALSTSGNDNGAAISSSSAGNTDASTNSANVSNGKVGNTNVNTSNDSVSNTNGSTGSTNASANNGNANVSNSNASAGSTGASSNNGETDASSNAVSTIPGVFTSANSQLGSVQNELQGLVGQQVDITVVQSKLEYVKGVISQSVQEVQAISANPSGGILALGGQTLTVVQAGSLVATFVSTTTTILQTAVSIVGSGNAGGIRVLITTIGGLLATVLQLVLPLVGGLLQNILPQIGNVTPTLSSLNLTQVLQVLNISA